MDELTLHLKVIVILTMSLLLPAVALAQGASDCHCRDPNGNSRDLGTIECVDITGTQYLVRCEMSTNTPYWKRINDGSGCPAA